VTPEIAKVFLQYGLLGAIAILALYYGWRKDREAKAAAEDHQAEMTKFADRYISKAETWAARYEELARELKSLVDAIRRPG
jgi:hypothetical protein